MDQVLAKRIGVFDRVVSFSNLWQAFWKAYRATRSSLQARQFHFLLERQLLQLHDELSSGRYTPGAYRHFSITDPKPRVISVAPFRDRVVHHAIVGVLEPIHEKGFIFDSYASRKEKGTHKAVLRAQGFLRKNAFFLKADIHKYFDSIHRGILLEMLSKKWKDSRLIALIRRILYNASPGETGLPIGNLTSQFFANVYLNPFDHFVKDQRGIPFYIRYMDDFVIFSDVRAMLNQHLETCTAYLKERLALKLKDRATIINRSTNGLPFLGMNIFPATIRIRRPNMMRSLRHFRRCDTEVKEDQAESERKRAQRVRSIWSRLEFASTYSFRTKILDRVIRE